MSPGDNYYCKPMCVLYPGTAVKSTYLVSSCHAVSCHVTFRVEELQRLGARRGGDGGSSGGGGKRKGSGRHQRSRGARGGWAGDELAHRLALQTMENYARSLRVRVSFVLLLLSCSRATRLYPISARNSI